MEPMVEKIGDVTIVAVQVDELDAGAGIQFDLVREQLGSQHLLDLALADGRLHHLRRRGVVEVDGGLSQEADGDVGDSARPPGGVGELGQGRAVADHPPLDLRGHHRGVSRSDQLGEVEGHPRAG